MKFPVVGYGPIRVAPYAWPGSKSNNEDLKGAVEAPPLPVDLRPSLLLAAMSCRPDAYGRRRPVLPGHKTGRPQIRVCPS